MNINDYINSGILELYVAGTLSETESKAVYDVMLKHPEVLQEVLEIETAIVKLTASLSPQKTIAFNTIKDQLNNASDEGKVINLNRSKSKWISYSGWAAALVLAGGLLWTIDQKSTLEDQIQTVNIEKDFIEIQMETSKTDLAETKNLLNIIRDQSIINIPLKGQAVAPEAYATVYWDKKDDTVYLDLQGLPEPPEGKVYQVWSLTLNPLTPTNLGTIDDFIQDDNKIFTLKNTNQSQAFGITLEPAGGSQTPTLEQLYTLGALAAL
ncbi:anti-sigma factor domain-containing protein [Olleya sp. HaHaR_3_96]|uniref:anti-sigma factor n=1 Tax=Olleya sp. HaHaR_3_96 TaxID=2745560 RepID=UPI001C4F3228|nr:anti-sigma factor [Olleya sp. HaHaR_3_96]QXP59605.1 anti-sigma factor [Olleya sp. HaHaR_3_96]